MNKFPSEIRNNEALIGKLGFIGSQIQSLPQVRVMYITQHLDKQESFLKYMLWTDEVKNSYFLYFLAFPSKMG